MKGRLWRALVWCWALTVVVVVLLVTWEIVWGGPAGDRANRAQVWGTLLTTVAILPPTLAWALSRLRRREAASSTERQVSGAADLLASKTFITWSQQLVQRGIQTPAPVRVHWRWADPDLALTREDLAAAEMQPTDPGPLPRQAEPGHPDDPLDSGLVTRLHQEIYARLRHGRLVLIGGPGAGKTGALALLLVEALRQRNQVAGQDAATSPVPVWLTLGSWDPQQQDLRSWVAATLGRDHPYLRAAEFGSDAPGQLFDTGRIALFLDGLDEMADAWRAAAIRRLAAESAGLRVVMTSRPDEYRSTIHDGEPLPYTAVVELRPVRTRTAARYLLDGRVGPARATWQTIAERIEAAPDGALARTLNIPLTLSLARAAYAKNDPTALLAPGLDDEQTLMAHLLDQILVNAYPEPRERAQAQRWLGWIAHHMNTDPTGPTRDLRWWQIPTWLPARQRHLVCGLVVGLMVGLVSGLMFGLTGGLVLGLVGGFMVGLTGGLISGLLSGLMGSAAHRPKQARPRWPTGSELRALLVDGLIFGLTGGLVGGLLVGIAFGPEFGLLGGLGVGLVGGLMGGLVIGLVGGLLSGLLGSVWATPQHNSADATPWSAYRGDRLGAVMISLVVGLAVGLGGGLAGGLVAGLADGIAIGIVLGLMVDLLTFTDNASTALLAAEVVPQVRFMHLLETALQRQVLRQTGAVYQFRHAALQDRLAAEYLSNHHI